jgi:hypothetical protein
MCREFNVVEVLCAGSLMCREFPLLLKEGWPQQTNYIIEEKAFLRPGWLIKITLQFYFVLIVF